MKNKFKIALFLCLGCFLWTSSTAFASACKVTEDADNKSSSDTLRYVVEEFLYDRSDTPCSSGSTDSGAGYEQTVKFDPTTGSGPVRSIVLSKVLTFDVRDAAGPVVVGNSTSQGYALIDGSGVTEKPLQCEEGSDDVYLRNLVIITDGIDQEMLLADSCLKAEDEFYVCNSKADYEAGVDAGLTPGADGWCGGSTDTTDDGTLYYPDEDGDGYGDEGATGVENNPGGYVEDNTDCDDATPSVHPYAWERCNGIDDDCDDEIDEGMACNWEWGMVTKYPDADGDGFGDASAAGRECPRFTIPSRLPDSFPGLGLCDGLVQDHSDCNDNEASINPDATEVCDGVDNNCNDLIDAEEDASLNCSNDDADGDGYTEDQNDCDDNDPERHPGATEICDGIDNNCDGNVDGGNVCSDADDDGYISDDETGGTDCNDNDATIHPDATEICGDGIDQDCSGADLSCGVEICDSGVDNDGDGLIGCDDPDCITDPLCSITVQETECADGIDNDSDGGIDCADSDCYNVVIDEATGTTCASMSVGIVGDGGNVLGGANLVGGCALGGFAGQGGSAGLWWLIAVLAFVRQRSSTK